MMSSSQLDGLDESTDSVVYGDIRFINILARD